MNRGADDSFGTRQGMTTTGDDSFGAGARNPGTETMGGNMDSTYGGTGTAMSGDRFDSGNRRGDNELGTTGTDYE